MPQIERPTHRQPLRDLPLSLFIQPEHMKLTSLLGKKRPYSPSSIVSPSKRRLLAVEGVLSPKSPFKRAVIDLQRALPSGTSPARDLFVELQSAGPTKRQAPIQLPGSSATKQQPKPLAGSLAPSLELQPHQAKPRVAPEPSPAEAQLLAALAAAPPSNQTYLPGAGHARPKISPEEDPEEDHYPGFDVFVDDGSQSEEPAATPSDSAEQRQHEMEGDGEGEEEEDDAKENQRPHDVSRLDLSVIFVLLTNFLGHHELPIFHSIPQCKEQHVFTGCSTIFSAISAET